MKKRAYAQRITDIEHSSFTPVVLSLTGGMGKEATQFYKRLASLLSAKWEQSYSITLGWLCCCLSFSLLRSSILCIRGHRSTKRFFSNSNFTPPPLDLVHSESNFTTFCVYPTQLFVLNINYLYYTVLYYTVLYCTVLV